MTIKMDMVKCSLCGQCHPVSRGCNVNDVNKYQKERKKWLTEGIFNSGMEVTQKDIDDILSDKIKKDENVCRWKRYYATTSFRCDSSDVRVMYETGCNKTINYMSPIGVKKEDGFIYCPYCGLKIEEVLK